MLNKIRTLFSRDRYFYGFLIFLVILIGQLPIILHVLHTPKGYYYPLLDKVSSSDYYYLALIRLGMGSEWFTRIPYIVVPHQSSIIQIFFVWLGKLSKLSGIGPAEMFALFRVLGGLIYALGAAILLKTFLVDNKARLAFLFFLFAQPLPVINLKNIFEQDFNLWVWHFGEAARRISSMPPHYTFGKGLALCSLVFLILYLKKGKISSAVFSGILGFTAGIIYPPPTFIILFGLVIASVVYMMRVESLHSVGIFLKKRFSGIGIFILGNILSLVLLKLELAKGYPWNMWQRVELGWNNPKMHFEVNFLSMLGGLVLLVPFSVKTVFGKEKNYWYYFLFFWFISAFLLFPIASFLNLGKFRFTEGAQIVPMAILALLGFQNVTDFITRVRNLNYARVFERAFWVFLIFNFFIFTVLVAYNSTKNLWNLAGNVYFHPGEVAALSYLEKHVPPNAIVLADLYPSNYIPAFAKVRTITGFSDFYPNFSEFANEREKIRSILENKLPDNEALQYLASRKIDYIYYEIFAEGEKKLYPRLLESVYRNAWYEIFKVKVGGSRTGPRSL